MLTVNDNKIRLTRGDTMMVTVELFDEGGEPYIPVEGDHIIFRVKQDASQKGVLIEKEVDLQDMMVKLEEEDTVNLPFGKYFYEVEVITANHEHFTVIEKTEFKISVELEDHDE